MVRLINQYTVVCKNKVPCSCDFRVNIHDCPEQTFLVTANWILIPYCTILGITAIICLYNLILIKDQPFFLPPRRDRGFLRPRPQHIYHSISLIYCPFQVLHSIFLLMDLYPNLLWAEIGQALPKSLTAVFAILYPLSIVMSTTSLEIRTNQNQLSRSSPISPALSDMSRVRQGVLIDTACIIIALLSLTLFITLAGLTGYYADIEDYDTANQFFTSQNLTWLVWGSFYMIIMLYLWIRFIGVAWDNMSDLDRSHTIKSPELQIKLDQLKCGCRNLSIPVVGQVITALIYLPAFLFYGLYYRSDSIFNFNVNILYMCIWDFFIPVIIHITQWIMISNLLKTPGACAPLSSTKSMIKDTDRDNNSDQNNQSNDRNHEEEATDNDIISEYDEKLNDEDLINFIKPNYQNLFGKNSIVTKYDDQFIPSPYPSNFKDNDNNSIIGTSSVPFINTNITITNDPLKNIPQHFRRQSDSSIIKQQKRSHSSSPIFLRNLNDSPKYSDETFHQEMVIENPLSPTSTIATTIFDRRRSKFTSTTTSSDSITLSSPTTLYNNDINSNSNNNNNNNNNNNFSSNNNNNNSNNNNNNNDNDSQFIENENIHRRQFHHSYSYSYSNSTPSVPRSYFLHNRSNSGGEVNIGRNNINRFNEGSASLPTTPTIGNVGNVNGNQQNNNLHNTSVRNQQLKEWLLKKPSPAIPRPQRLDSYRESI